MTRRTTILLALITAAAAALRFSLLTTQSFWYDEVITANLVNQPLGAMLATIPRSESTPPLYYCLAWLWVHLFGNGEAGLRSLSALLGTITVPLAFLLGTKVTTDRSLKNPTGLILAALTAASPLLIWYSQEARAYALLVLLSTLLCIYFLQTIAEPIPRNAIPWGIIASLTLATHYFAFFLVAPMAGWLLLINSQALTSPQSKSELQAERERKRKSQPKPTLEELSNSCPWLIYRACALPVIAGILLLPLSAIQTAHAGAAFITTTPLSLRTVQIFKQFLVGYNAPWTTAALIGGLALFTYGCHHLIRGNIHILQKEPEEIQAIPLAAMASTISLALVAPIVLAALGTDYVLTRNMLAVWMPVVALVALGLAMTKRIGALVTGLACVAAVVLVVMVNTQAGYGRPDWRGAAAGLATTKPNRVIVLTPSAGIVPLQHYTGERFSPIGKQGVRTAEVTVLAMAERRDGQNQQLFSPVPANTLPGFQLVKEQKTSDYTLLSYRAAHSQLVKPQTLAHLALRANGFALLAPKS